MNVTTLAPQFRGIPTLKTDAGLGPKLDHYGSQNAVRLRLERRIVWNLLRHLEANGFRVVKVDDGGDIIKTADKQAAMEVIFSVDYAVLCVAANNGNDKHSVALVLGNSVDIVSDWSYSKDDADGFNAVMDAFDASVFG